MVSTTGRVATLTRHRYSKLSKEVRIGDKLYTNVSLDFTMEHQQCTNWCWAATATSVSHYYLSESPWVQCAVVNAELDHNDCCDNPIPGANNAVPSECNVAWQLDRALERTDNFESWGSVNFEVVRNEIDAGRVVGVRIGWRNADGSWDGGHFLAIYGYTISDDGTQYFDVGDPWYGNLTIETNQFTVAYQGIGAWTHTYLTRQAARMIKIKSVSLSDAIIRAIWDTRPLLHLNNHMQEIQSPRDLSLAIPHAVYTMGLDDLIQGRGFPQQPTALRVLEMQGEKSLAFFDVDASRPSSPRIRQMGTNPYLSAFGRAMNAVTQKITQSEAEAEVRLLQVPPLHFEALWLHYDDSAQDSLTPLSNIGTLAAFKDYSANEFLSELGKIARAQPAMGDAMGG